MFAARVNLVANTDGLTISLVEPPEAPNALEPDLGERTPVPAIGKLAARIDGHRVRSCHVDIPIGELDPDRRLGRDGRENLSDMLSCYHFDLLSMVFQVGNIVHDWIKYVNSSVEFPQKSPCQIAQDQL